MSGSYLALSSVLQRWYTFLDQSRLSSLRA